MSLDDPPTTVLRRVLDHVDELHRTRGPDGAGDRFATLEEALSFELTPEVRHLVSKEDPGQSGPGSRNDLVPRRGVQRPVGEDDDVDHPTFQTVPLIDAATHEHLHIELKIPGHLDQGIALRCGLRFRNGRGRRGAAGQESEEQEHTEGPARDASDGVESRS